MVEERNTFITSIKSEIYRKEYKNDTQRVDLHQQLFQKESVIKKLEVCMLRGREGEREGGREKLGEGKGGGVGEREEEGGR